MIVRITRVKVGHRQAPNTSTNKALLVRALSFWGIKKEGELKLLCILSVRCISELKKLMLKAIQSEGLRQFHFLSYCLFAIMFVV